jgi:hypothetical protein
MVPMMPEIALITQKRRARKVTKSLSSSRFISKKLARARSLLLTGSEFGYWDRR